MNELRGFLPLFRHELSTGWGLPLGIAGLAVLAAATLHGSYLRLDDPTIISFLLMGFAFIGVPLGARRLLAEFENGSFLASRPMSRLGGVLAKGAATALDLAIIALAMLWLTHELEALMSARLLGWLSRRGGDSYVPRILLGLGGGAAVAFGFFASVRSPWAAGALTLLGCFLGFVLLGDMQRPPHSLLLPSALAVGAALILALICGRPWREGER